MTEQMERRVAESIGRMEGLIRPPVEILLYPARPELFDTGRGKSLGGFIPQAKVQVHQERNLRIEEIAPPLPACLADQRRQVVDGKFLSTLNGFVTEAS